MLPVETAMHAFHRFSLAAALALLGAGLLGCANSRIAGHSAEFASLDPATQHAIRQGEVHAGYTPDMVEMAFGQPRAVRSDAQGRTVWEYRREPLTATNETIVNGFRRRVVYDPVKRTEDVIMEPIDTKAFPNLVPRLLRVTFADGRVVSVTSEPAR